MVIVIMGTAQATVIVEISNALTVTFLAGLIALIAMGAHGFKVTVIAPARITAMLAQLAITVIAIVIAAFAGARYEILFSY